MHCTFADLGSNKVSSSSSTITVIKSCHYSSSSKIAVEDNMHKSRRQIHGGADDRVGRHTNLVRRYISLSGVALPPKRYMRNLGFFVLIVLVSTADNISPAMLSRR